MNIEIIRNKSLCLFQGVIKLNKYFKVKNYKDYSLRKYIKIKKEKNKFILGFC